MKPGNRTILHAKAARMIGHFGFSYIGLIYIIMLTVPNIIWARNMPNWHDQSGEALSTETRK